MNTPHPSPLRWDALALASGLIFSLGLGLAGMTQPGKVLAFLDVTGDWDPSLAMVMIGAIGVHALALRVILRRPTPLSGGAFHIPTQRTLDARLVVGAGLFGLGWGLGGFCPGPAITSAVTLAPSALLFVATMCAGLWAGARIESALAARATNPPGERLTRELVG